MLAPSAALSFVAAAIVLFGPLRVDGSLVLLSAPVPVGSFFDVRQAIAHGSGWFWVFLACVAGALVRGGVHGVTLWLADDRRGRTQEMVLVLGWCVVLSAAAAALMIVPAGLFFVGVALRYTPFVVLAGGAGVAIAAVLLKRVVAVPAGAGLRGARSGGVASVLFFGYLLAAGAAVIELAPVRAVAAATVLVTGLLGGLFVAGKRDLFSRGVDCKEGSLAVALTGAVAAALLFSAVMDRYVRDIRPAIDTRGPGTLLILGGADSATGKGSMSDFDPEAVGFSRDRAIHLSYRGRYGGAQGAPEKYSAADTHRDLDSVTRSVAAQLEAVPPPRFFIGHSQAALVLDRMLARDPVRVAAAVELAPPPVAPPPIDAPRPGVYGPGAPGADLARALSKGLARLGAAGNWIDSPASPARLTRVVTRGGVRRLAVWALADSVWLEGDWRRPHETNIVAVTDHVGTANDPRAIAAARAFFAGKKVRDDGSSWRAWPVYLLRAVFEPWRP